MYEYSAHMIRVINGNTIEAVIDLGFEISIKQKIRLYGIHISDDEAGKTALINLIPREFVVRTMFNKRGKIGRILGVVLKEDDQGTLININELLIDKGLAKKFDT